MRAENHTGSTDVRQDGEERALCLSLCLSVPFSYCERWPRKEDAPHAPSVGFIYKGLGRASSLLLQDIGRGLFGQGENEEQMKSVQMKRPKRNVNHLRIHTEASRASPGSPQGICDGAGSPPRRGGRGGLAAVSGEASEGPTREKIRNCRSAP